MQDFITAIKNKDEKQIIHLLNSKQTVGKQMHQTLLTFKHNYTGVLNGTTLMVVLKASIARLSRLSILLTDTIILAIY